MKQPKLLPGDQLEAKHIVYVKSLDDPTGDACVIKEVIHRANGTMEPNLRIIRNYQRDWHMTREGHRKHKDKKGSEKLSRLQRFVTNDRVMPLKIAKILRKNPNNLQLKRLARSPYLYGTDITSPAILKHKYKQKFPEASSPNTLAVLDIETDVRSAPLPENQEIIYIGLTMKNKAFLCYTKKYMEGVADPDRKLQEAFAKYLGAEKNTRNMTLETMQVDDPGHAVYEAIKRAHAWMPDFLVVYNLDFDMSVMLKMCEKYNYNFHQIFSDPSVPADLQYVNYIRGQSKRVTSSGKVMSFNPWERWHTMLAPASFYPICAMSTYAFIRKAQGNELSYKLDYILDKVIGKRKLNFTFADHITDTTEWHFYMQAQHKIEYGIYCLFDCIRVEELDEETTDLEITLPELNGFSEYQHFNSTPKQLADDMHYFHLEKRDSVIASVSDQMETEDDAHVVTMDGWIITLRTQLVADNGLKVVKGMPSQPTLYRAHVADLDIRSAYPWGEVCMNVGIETTTLELCRIEGIDLETQRVVGLNLSGGPTNAVEYCTTIHKFPTFQQVLTEWDKAA